MSCIALCDPPNWKIVSLCIFDRLESRTFWWINILNILSFLSATNPNWYMSHDDRSNDDLMSLSLVTTLNELDKWIRPLGWNKELYDIDSITVAGRPRSQTSGAYNLCPTFIETYIIIFFRFWSYRQFHIAELASTSLSLESRSFRNKIFQTRNFGRSHPQV